MSTITKKRLRAGDLVMVHEIFDTRIMDWKPSDCAGIVMDIDFQRKPSHTLVTVLVDGRVIDDYYENDLTVV